MPIGRGILAILPRRGLAKRVRLLVIPAVLLVALSAPSTAGSQGAGCSQRVVEVGIVKAKGCFTESTQNGAKVFVAPNGKQGEGVDLNGFIVQYLGRSESALKINTKTNEVTSDLSQVNSKNWPAGGRLTKLGNPLKLAFVAPKSGSLLLEDIRFGSNDAFKNALAGFSAVADVDTPIMLEEGGKGSMDLTVALTGYFTLKDKAQSAALRLPTEVGKGTVLDGFEIKLKEIDALKVFKLEGFEALYSAAEKKFEASATVKVPFTRDKGFTGTLGITNGRLSKLGINVSGLKLPIGTPPAGFMTDIGGGFDLAPDGNITANAMLAASFGPDIPTPFGVQAPIGANAAFQFGKSADKSYFFKVVGGVAIFRLPVGNVNLELYTSGGVNFGAGLGIGFPSYRNSSHDPFYIGVRVGGWIAKQKFQFDGQGRVRLLGLNIFDGRILVNHRAAGACWKVLGLNGGAVYRYGARAVQTFGIGCGLDAYREKFPLAARVAGVSASQSRKVRLDGGQIVLEATGRGGPPRFTARSSDGRVYRSPAKGAARQFVKARDHLFFVNTTGTNKTHLFIRRPKGSWTITPHPGSPPIVSVKAGRRQPKERVEAEVRGRGKFRTLVWRSRGRAHTRLIFTEKMEDGVEFPILDTDRARGRHRFRALQGAHYGKRKLRVVVQHGHGSLQQADVDTYRAHPPKRLKAPRRVRARRYIHSTHVNWSRVKGATGYLVEVSKGRGRRKKVSFLRRVSRRRRSVSIHRTPGGGHLVAKVHALNSDGRLGRPKARRFATGPSARSLRTAARHSARSSRRGKGVVRVVTHCPASRGHCQGVVRLVKGRRVVGTVRFQQVPDTFHLHRIRPTSARIRRLLRQGRHPRLRVVVRLRRVAGGVHGRAAQARSSARARL